MTNAHVKKVYLPDDAYVRMDGLHSALGDKLKVLKEKILKLWESQKYDNIEKAAAQYRDTALEPDPEIEGLVARLPAVQWLKAADAAIKASLKLQNADEHEEALDCLRSPGVLRADKGAALDADAVRKTTAKLETQYRSLVKSWVRHARETVETACQDATPDFPLAENVLASIERIPIAPESRAQLANELSQIIESARGRYLDWVNQRALAGCEARDPDILAWALETYKTVAGDLPAGLATLKKRLPTIKLLAKLESLAATLDRSILARQWQTAMTVFNGLPDLTRRAVMKVDQGAVDEAFLQIEARHAEMLEKWLVDLFAEIETLIAGDDQQIEQAAQRIAELDRIPFETADERERHRIVLQERIHAARIAACNKGIDLGRQEDRWTAVLDWARRWQRLDPTNEIARRHEAEARIKLFLADLARLGGQIDLHIERRQWRFAWALFDELPRLNAQVVDMAEEPAIQNALAPFPERHRRLVESWLADLTVTVGALCSQSEQQIEEATQCVADIDLIPFQDESDRERSRMQLNMRIKRARIEQIQKAIETARSESRWQDALTLCRKCLAVDPTNECAQRRATEAERVIAAIERARLAIDALHGGHFNRCSRLCNEIESIQPYLIRFSLGKFRGTCIDLRDEAARCRKAFIEHVVEMRAAKTARNWKLLAATAGTASQLRPQSRIVAQSRRHSERLRRRARSLQIGAMVAAVLLIMCSTVAMFVETSRRNFVAALDGGDSKEAERMARRIQWASQDARDYLTALRLRCENEALFNAISSLIGVRDRPEWADLLRRDKTLKEHMQGQSWSNAICALRSSSACLRTIAADAGAININRRDDGRSFVVEICWSNAVDTRCQLLSSANAYYRAVRGDYSLRVNNADYQPWQTNICVVAGGHCSVDVAPVLKPGSVLVTGPMAAIINEENNSFTGLTGEIITNVPPGAYQIIVEAPAFRKAKASVEVLPGRMTEQAIDLVRQEGIITIDAIQHGLDEQDGRTAQGAALTIGTNVPIGVDTFPFCLRGVPPGFYDLTLTAPGYKTCTVAQVAVRDAETTKEAMRLIPNPFRIRFESQEGPVITVLEHGTIIGQAGEELVLDPLSQHVLTLRAPGRRSKVFKIKPIPSDTVHAKQVSMEPLNGSIRVRCMLPENRVDPNPPPDNVVVKLLDGSVSTNLPWEGGEVSNVTEGVHTLTVHVPGFAPSLTTQVTVVDQQTATVRPVLDPEDTVVVFTNALAQLKTDVILNGKVIGLVGQPVRIPSLMPNLVTFETRGFGSFSRPYQGQLRVDPLPPGTVKQPINAMMWRSTGKSWKKQ